LTVELAHLQSADSESLAIGALAHFLQTIGAKQKS
jgi:hypothetical protein